MRHKNIDLMKFIAIYLVIFYHFTTFEHNFIENPQIIVYINYFLRSICSMCVPLFFFVNGFLLIKKDLDINKHIKLMVRLILITIIWSVIEVFLISKISAKSLSVYDFFLEIWIRKTGMVGHLWFIGALICVYIFFPLIKNAYDNNKKVFNYFIAISTIIVFGNSILSMIASFGYYFSIGWIDNDIVDNVLNMYNPFGVINSYAFGYFCVGCFVGGYRDKFEKFFSKYTKKTILVFIIFTSMCLLSLYGVFKSFALGEEWDNIWYGYDTIFTLINVISVYFLCLNYKGLHNKLYNYIKCVSVNTLGIFFVHGIIVSCFKTLNLTECQLTSNFIANVLLAFIILNISLIIILILKKIPIVKKIV